MYSRKLTKDTHRKKEGSGHKHTHHHTKNRFACVSVHDHSDLHNHINLPNHSFDYHLSDLHDQRSDRHNQHINPHNHHWHHVFPQSDRLCEQHEPPRTDEHDVDNDHGCLDYRASKC